MSGARALRLATVVLAAGLGAPLAQEPPPAPAPAEPLPEWTFAGSVDGWFVPEEEFLVVAIVRADRGNLHLETRYNDEERGTGSLWAGWTFSFGEKVTLDLTPMLGALAGDLDGVAPGVELDFNWKRLSFYFEGAYIHDLDDSHESFVYGWSELSFAITDWLDAGLVGQRTRLYDNGLDVQRGLLIGLSWRRLGLTGYFFNPGGDDHFEVVSLSVEF